MRYCPFCAYENLDWASLCTRCGKPQPVHPNARAHIGAAGASPAASTAPPERDNQRRSLSPNSRARGEQLPLAAVGAHPSSGGPTFAKATELSPALGLTVTRTITSTDSHGASSAPLPAPGTTPAPPGTPGDLAFHRATTGLLSAIPSVGGPSAGATPASLPPEPRAELPSDTDPAELPVPEAAQGTELPQLPPQPASHGPLDSLRYAVTVLRGIYLRRTRIARLRRTNVEAQTRLDDVLRELGRAARTEKLQLAGLAEEMQATDAAQERKARAEAERAEYQRVRDAEQQKLEQFASEKLREIADCKAELTAREAERKGKLSERRALTDQLARFDAQLKSIGRQVQSKQAELIKKVTTVDAPTEPTGDEAASGAVVSAAIGDSARLRLETEIETLQQSATALDEPREAAQDKLRQLEAPIAELLLSIDTLRERGETLRRELETAQRESAAEQRTLEAEADKRANEIHSASREISQRLSTLGTLVNLKRVDSPLFAPLYQQVDGLKLEMAQRDTQIQGLSAEAEAYDRSALHKGLVAAALLAAGLVALLVVLAVAL